MNLFRRKFLQFGPAIVLLAASSRMASAQSYPSRPVHLVVGYPPGGPTDIVARIMGQYLSDRLGQTFVIENRPGAGSNLASEAVVRSPPDGHTLLLVASANAINSTLYNRLSFNFIEDIALVAPIIRQPFVMEVNPSVPATTVPEFMAYAMANPGKINMASAGNGTPHHVFGELFKAMTGLDLSHVPYRGEAPALTDLLGGQVQLMFGSITASIEHIRAGRLRPLAVTTATRSEVLPDAPTVGEFVPGYEASAWVGIGVPRKTPAEIIAKLNAEIRAGLADAKVKTRLAELGATVFASSPAEFRTFVAEETEKWSKVVKFAGVTAN